MSHLPCPFPEASARDYRALTVFMDGRPFVLNCSDTLYNKICRGAAAGVNWKEIERLVKKIFGVQR